MNRMTLKIIVAMLVVLSMLAACGKNKNEVLTIEVTEEPTLAVTEEETTEATLETLAFHGDPQVGDNWEDEETTEATVSDERKPQETKPQETKPQETKPQETKPQETQPQETKPQETKPQETQPQETKPQETKPALKDPLAQEYEGYMNMSPEQQQAKYEKMGPAAFMEWYQRAKAAYDAAQNYIEISGGEIDLGKLG